MVEKAASAMDAIIERGVKEVLERAGKRRFTTQDLMLLLLYDMRGRASATEEAVRSGFSSSIETMRQGFERMDKRFDDLTNVINNRFDDLNKRLDALTAEIRSFREDMKPLWSALAKLVEAQAKT